ncbi:hypothetical protein KR009_008047 [Drosophila setifemur]|nr:hypothetical protein KR009_008047 [Drosophila setifemur]
MKLLLWIICILVGKSQEYVRLTNIKCVSMDKTFLMFPTCQLKVLGRGIIAANVYGKLLKVPINKMTIRFNVHRKLSGYHPFLFNVSLELCGFLKHPNPMHVFYYVHRAFLPNSNVNHTCPYNHDFFVKNLTLKDSMFAKVPLPKGNYMLTLELDDGMDPSTWVAMLSIYMDVDFE